MKDKKENRILFGPGGCLTRQAVALFIDDELTDQEKKKLLRHAKDCELCADALEGAQHFSSGAYFQTSLGRFDNSPWRQHFEERKTRKLFVGISSVAASIALLIGVYFVFQIKNVVDKKGQYIPMADVAVIDESKDSIALVRSNIVEDLNETSPGKSEPDETKKQKSIPRKPAVPQENIVIVESDMDVELFEEIEFEEMNNEELALDKIEVFEEEEEIVLHAFAKTEEQPKAVAGYVDLAKEEIPVSQDKSLFRKRSFKNVAKEQTEDKFYVAEVKPMFRGGGIDSFNKYLVDSLRVVLPDTVLNQPIIVGFRVDTAGNVNNVKLISGTSSKEYNKEIVRLVKQSPMWSPALLNGQKIAVDQQLQVVFNGN